jgi:hypothetical protein
MAARLAGWAFWALLLLLAALLALYGPLLTSDGPAHVGIAQALRHHGDPAWPMLNRLYEPNPALTPNALGHYALAALLLVLPPAAAETALQAACLLSIPLAARLLLHRIAPDAAWLALFFFPVALQRLFFLGLYNYCLSLAFLLLSLHAFLRLRHTPTAGRTLALAALLLLTLASQAAGWMAAAAVLPAILATDLALRTPRTAATLALTTLAALPSAALFLLFAATGPGGTIEYGPGPLERLADVLRGAPFATIGRAGAGAALALTLALLALVAAGLARARGETLRRALPFCAVPLALLVLLLAIPDRAGGGWTHAWRAAPLPAIGLAIATAALPLAPLLRHAATALAASLALLAIALPFRVQALDAPPLLAALAEADALIPPHCTTVPVLGHYKLDAANTARLAHHPAFHLAQRLQWRDDRPVLFSYNARLPLYPARFRPEADPHIHMFRWQPAQGDTLVRTLDIQAWEAASGLTADYVLLWDLPPDSPPARALAGYTRIHHSADGRLELYRRAGSPSCADRRPGSHPRTTR